jgi:hypothetical protein
MMGELTSMTEQEARDKAEGLASCIGITFYVVRSPQGDLLTVQAPPDGCEILATVPPPTSVHDQGLASTLYTVRPGRGA